MAKTFTTYSPEETMALAGKLGRMLGKGDIIALVGDLGAGKTVFVKGLAGALEVPDYQYVNSPTFTIMKEYRGIFDLYHFDVYRIGLESFCDTIDYRRYFYSEGVTVIEWADKIEEVLPEEYIEVNIKYGRKDERCLTLRGIGNRFEPVIEGM